MLNSCIGSLASLVSCSDEDFEEIRSDSAALERLRQFALSALRPAESVAKLVVERRYLEWDCSAKEDKEGHLFAQAFPNAAGKQLPEGEYPLFAAPPAESAEARALEEARAIIDTQAQILFECTTDGNGEWSADPLDAETRDDYDKMLLCIDHIDAALAARSAR